jgi:isopenicillin-N N-acyltransferase like protein
MIVMTPAQGVMEIAPLPAVNRSFTRYELTMDARATERAA